MQSLLDTNVVSETRKPSPNAGVIEFIQGQNAVELWISVVTIGEITKGIFLLPEGRKRQAFLESLFAIESQFSDRVLAIDAEVARAWGRLTAQVTHSGFALPAADGLIAATALVHDLVLVTRNVRDFEHTGVRVLNPWTD